MNNTHIHRKNKLRILNLLKPYYYLRSICLQVRPYSALNSTTDISQIFQDIQVHPEEQPLQRIYWRELLFFFLAYNSYLEYILFSIYCQCFVLKVIEVEHHHHPVSLTQFCPSYFMWTMLFLVLILWSKPCLRRKVPPSLKVVIE